VHVRRALLLFALVLGLAALVAAVSQPRRDSDEARPRPAPAPTARPGPGGPSDAQIRFRVQDSPATRMVEAGRPATILVQVPEPGQVAVDGLGLVASADPLTPARFEVLERRPARHRIRFTPARAGSAVTAGVLAIVEG
jgi:hypothetical protein